VNQISFQIRAQRTRREKGIHAPAHHKPGLQPRAPLRVPEPTRAWPMCSQEPSAPLPKPISIPPKRLRKKSPNQSSWENHPMENAARKQGGRLFLALPATAAETKPELEPRLKLTFYFSRLADDLFIAADFSLCMELANRGVHASTGSASCFASTR